ncbi:S41 family peptidase [Deinococcus humi]|uniref:Tail specific protease domain-containing protein n=1 Tax=Deinococcus humi TaxID=662880 RepID=A0A7W8NIE8_9DEIO|nr:S41 family peptidase [Deinococcus humi]MBB5365773.1 hypothetical protein [Deinococcus humi]GGO41094.1 peptidase S41 [Deinococcus humi]
MAPVPALTCLEALAQLTALVQHFSPRAVATTPDWAGFLVGHLPTFEQDMTASVLAAQLQAAFQQFDPRLQVLAEMAPESLPLVPAREVTFVLHIPYGDVEREMVLRPPQLVTLHLEDLAVQEVTVTDLPVVGTVRVPFPGFQPRVFPLPGGLSAVFPLTEPGHLERDPEPFSSMTLDPQDKRTQMASVMLLWGKLRFLYPYWTELSVDWDAALRRALQEVTDTCDDEDFTIVLEEMLALLEDAHVYVRPAHLGYAVHALPFCVEWIDGQLLVSNTELNAGPERGAEVLELDGEDALTLYQGYEARASGIPEVRRYRACTRLVGRDEAQSVRVTWQTPAGKRQSSVIQTRPGREPRPEQRPEPLTTLEMGIGYLDWTRAEQDREADLLALIGEVNVLIVDGRGYPTELAMTLFRALARQEMGLPALLVPVVTSPDAHDLRFKDIAKPWFQPNPARPDVTLLFLTNAHGTQSYAESLLSMVEAYGLGQRFGSRSAGCNGMIAVLELPSGHRVRWTGVRTLRSGGRPLFRVGIPADQDVRRSRAGVVAGRDEVLEAALGEARRVTSAGVSSDPHAEPRSGSKER